MSYVNPYDGFRAEVVQDDVNTALVIHVKGGSELVETVTVLVGQFDTETGPRPYILEEQLLRVVCRYLTAGGSRDALLAILAAADELACRYGIDFPEGYQLVGANLLNDSPHYILVNPERDLAMVVREDDATERMTVEDLGRIISFVHHSHCEGSTGDV